MNTKLRQKKKSIKRHDTIWLKYYIAQRAFNEEYFKSLENSANKSKANLRVPDPVLDKCTQLLKKGYAENKDYLELRKILIHDLSTSMGVSEEFIGSSAENIAHMLIALKK